jgi:hypothetical protein
MQYLLYDLRMFETVGTKLLETYRKMSPLGAEYLKVWGFEFVQHGISVGARIANVEMICISPSLYPYFYILKAKYYSRFSNVLYIFIKTV